MINDLPFTELEARKYLLFFCAVLFIGNNWGSTIEGLNHIVLSARSHSFETVEGELAKSIGVTTVPFGKTISNLIGIGLLGGFVYIIIRKLNLDQNVIKDDASRLLKENALLLKRLETVQSNLITLYDVTENIFKKFEGLYEHQDRLVELSVELEKILNKAERVKNNRKKDYPKDGPDLFDAAKHKPKSKFKKRRPPRPRQKTKPDF